MNSFQICFQFQLAALHLGVESDVSSIKVWNRVETGSCAGWRILKADTSSYSCPSSPPTGTGVELGFSVVGQCRLNR